MHRLRLALAVARVFLLYCFSSAFVNSSHSSDGCPPSTTIGFHSAVCSPDGNLALPLAFSSLEDAVLRSVSWYRDSPLSEHGYPPVWCACCATPSHLFSRINYFAGAGALDVRGRAI